MKNVYVYKEHNPSGKVYLKMDMNRFWLSRLQSAHYFGKLIQLCDLISAESGNLYELINQRFPFKVELIPNGYYETFTSGPLCYSDKENIILTAGRLGTFQKQTDILLRAFLDADIGITTNPMHYDTIMNLPWKQLVYDCLDRYEGFFPEGHPMRNFILKRERNLLDRADFVFASARVLCEDKARFRPVHYLPHGVEVEYFQAQAGDRPSELRAIKGPIVGFVGNVEHKVNLE
jgi:hypothetical protein